MPRTPRTEMFDDTEVGIYHCVNWHLQKSATHILGISRKVPPIFLLKSKSAIGRFLSAE